MKISEAIKELEQMKYRYGDIPVAIHVDGWGDEPKIDIAYHTYEDDNFKSGEGRVVLW